MAEQNRRRFLQSMGIAAVGAGALATPGKASAPPRDKRGTDDLPGLDAIAKMMIETPRDEVFAATMKLTEQGLTHRDLLGAVFLAGVLDIQPRPQLGFKFHTVLMGSSAYQVAEKGRAEDRFLPALFNLDDFKKAQRDDNRQGDWHLPPRNKTEFGDMADPAAELVDAMEAWDDTRSDEAVAQVHERMDLDSAFELIWPYGGRCRESIGHKMIFASHCYRTLQEIGWRYGEPALRSLVYGLNLKSQGDNSATFDPNRTASEKIRDEWLLGEEDPRASAVLLKRLRRCTPQEASEAVIELLNDGVAPSSVWDGLRLCAFEMLMQRPGIVPLHAVTNLNAMHYGFLATRRDETKRLLLLQTASFLPMFRGQARGDEGGIDSLKPSGRGSVEEVFRIADDDKPRAAGMIMTGCENPEYAAAYSDMTRQLLVRKATGHHDYKYVAAALEEWDHAHPDWAPHLRAAGLFWLKTAVDEDGSVYRRALPLLRER